MRKLIQENSSTIAIIGAVVIISIIVAYIILPTYVFTGRDKENNMVGVTTKLLIHSPIENGQIEIYQASYGVAHEDMLELIKFDKWFSISDDYYTSGDVLDIGVRHIDEEFNVDHMSIAYNVKLPKVENKELVDFDFFNIHIEYGIHDYENRLEL